MSKRPVFFAAPMERIRRERRQRMISLWVSLLFFLLISALAGWLVYLIKTVPPEVLRSSFLVPGSRLAMAPLHEGMLLGLLLFFSAALIVLAVRKVKRDDEFFASLRREPETPAPWAGRSEDEDVFAPLREPGAAIPTEDVQRILVACAAESRCIMKHVRRAQTTLSVEDYGDELALAERKLDGVTRCVEALVGRLGGSQMGRGIERAEMEGGRA